MWLFWRLGYNAGKLGCCSWWLKVLVKGLGCCNNSYNISRVTQQEGKHSKERREGMVPLRSSDSAVHGSAAVVSSGDRLRLTWTSSRTSLPWSCKNCECFQRLLPTFTTTEDRTLQSNQLLCLDIYGGTIRSPECVFIRPLCRCVPPSTGVPLYSEIWGVGHQGKQQFWGLWSPRYLISSLNVFICEIKTWCVCCDGPLWRWNEVAY